jgi:dTDP-4-amino-4,6-dideoxy-D-galactose acyltransferase
VAAGAYSRFRRDSWIPRRAFERLYEIWMDRSTLGELAETVLVAIPEEDDGRILGVITIAVHEKEGQIGLVAVDPAARGRGISSTLVAAAHEWMAANRLIRSRVVTQRDNEAACRLYERACYRLVDLVHLYHFWPLGPATERDPGAWPEP